jgi:hypothetical protein
MLSNTSSAPARRTRRHSERRTRRRPAFVAAGLAFAVLAAAGITATTPTSQAEASGSSFGAFELASFTTTTEPQVTSTVSGTEDSSTAREALAAAETALAAAQTVTADIEASGLPIGEADPTVDTDDLDGAVERLDVATRNDTPFVPNLTDDLTVQIATVNERVASLRGSLDAAIALKAEQEAAEKARKEAAAAAKAAAEAAANAAKASTGAGSAPVAPRYAASGTSAGEAQATARSMLSRYGWGDDQFSCIVSLWNKESGWNYQAYNQSSGAYGIPQALPGSKMGSAGADWQTNPATQIAWGFGYISARYGSPCGAWSHSQAYGWY